MAQRTIVTTHSDLSGEPDAVTVRFAFENARWEIDLTPSEREAFVRTIAPYTEKARRASASRPARQGRLLTGSGQTTATGPGALPPS